MGRKTILRSFSLEIDISNYIDTFSNKSAIVSEAIRTHKQLHTTKEGKVKQLKAEKKKLISQANEIAQKIRDMEET